MHIHIAKMRKWNSMCRKICERNSEQIHDMKNMYRAEKAMHDLMNAATKNLQHAVDSKESLKMSPDAKAMPSKSTASKSTARSNVASKQKRSINIIKAMQARFGQQKMKKEHWQNVHHELMESSAE